jgi:hypothetical protein
MHKYPRLHGCAIASSEDSAMTNLAGESVSFYLCITDRLISCIYKNPITSKAMNISPN